MKQNSKNKKEITKIRNYVKAKNMGWTSKVISEFLLGNYMTTASAKESKK